MKVLDEKPTEIGTQWDRIDPGVRMLSTTGTWALVFGLFPATAAEISASAERWLRRLTGITCQFGAVTQKAMARG